MKLLKWTILIVSTLWPLVAMPQTPPIFGDGRYSCGNWTKEPTGSTRDRRVQWIAGFISAYNAYHVTQENVFVDFNGMVAWIDKFCSYYPLVPISIASGKLIDQLRHQRNLSPIMGSN
jgi:hypothetical protein